MEKKFEKIVAICNGIESINTAQSEIWRALHDLDFALYTQQGGNEKAEETRILHFEQAVPLIVDGTPEMVVEYNRATDKLVTTDGKCLRLSEIGNVNLLRLALAICTMIK